MENPELQAIKALRSISRNEKIKSYLLQNTALYKAVLKSAKRFIGGETLEECFQTSKKIVQKGHSFTVDFMGESIRNRKHANEATEEFIQVLKKITVTKSNASISLDLSHIGTTIDKNLGLTNAMRIAQKAKDLGIEMMISMEGIDRVSDILEIYYKLSESYTNVGITLQAYLHRTSQDITKAIKYPGKIRLVKGAYQVSTKHALPLGQETDQVYKKYIKQIISNRHLCSIATHNTRIVLYIKKLVNNFDIDIKSLEFEMLHGVTPLLLDQLHASGFKTRKYLPYGKEWYLYFCHRLAENPLNIYRALADTVGD